MQIFHGQVCYSFVLKSYYHEADILGFTKLQSIQSWKQYHHIPKFGAKKYHKNETFLTMHIVAAMVLAFSTLPKTFCNIESLTSTATKIRFPIGSNA